MIPKSTNRDGSRNKQASKTGLCLTTDGPLKDGQNSPQWQIAGKPLGSRTMDSGKRAQILSTPLKTYRRR